MLVDSSPVSYRPVSYGSTVQYDTGWPVPKSTPILTSQTVGAHVFASAAHPVDPSYPADGFTHGYESRERDRRVSHADVGTDSPSRGSEIPGDGEKTGVASNAMSVGHPHSSFLSIRG
jgi:hypothetical protein